MSKLSILAEFWEFLRLEKVLVSAHRILFTSFGTLIVLTEGQQLPFIYALF